MKISQQAYGYKIKFDDGFIVSRVFSTYREAETYVLKRRKTAETFAAGRTDLGPSRWLEEVKK